MIEGNINLYSDTQTRPTSGMMEAMLEAKVGDEQHGLDPTVDELCERVADLLGKEAAVFLPSGTMCNEIAILVHCRPGDEIYAHRTAHIISSEAGGPAALAGVSIYQLDGDRGIYSADSLRSAIRQESRYTPRPCLVEIEQTANAGGGSIWPLDGVMQVAAVAKEYGLLMHMDGARLLNAVVGSGIPARDYTAPFDSAWLDLSKGLGCPIGGVLAGSRNFVDEAWRWKQRIGGALRQAGFLAAAGLYALEHHVDRLAEDHEKARRFGEIVAQCEGVCLTPELIQTNLVFIDIAETGLKAIDVRDRLETRGINIGAMGETRLRAVTHLDVNRAQVEEAAHAFVSVVEELR
ncbi:threonine aldolase family protein [Chloroflexi bacterium TSY]|nr:threonine aldolase family protein [Chloroflexi bacterium TSY]